MVYCCRCCCCHCRVNLSREMYAYRQCTHPVHTIHRMWQRQICAYANILYVVKGAPAAAKMLAFSPFAPYTSPSAEITPPRSTHHPPYGHHHFVDTFDTQTHTHTHEHIHTCTVSVCVCGGGGGIIEFMYIDRPYILANAVRLREGSFHPVSRTILPHTHAHKHIYTHKIYTSERWCSCSCVCLESGENHTHIMLSYVRLVERARGDFSNGRTRDDD